MLVAGLAMIIVGLAFKSSAAPFHMWTPDAYQGAPTPVTAFMASATKIAALAVTYRLLVTAFPQDERLWTVAIAAIAIVSLAWGNIAALVQRNVKRILAYSSISHAGFMLIAVAANNELGARALMYYLIPYAAMSLGAFAVIAARERELGVPVTLDNLAGLGWERPFFGISMWVFMLGFLGFPLTGGFVGKFYVFAAAYERGWWWLIVAGVIATMISAYYYLGIVRAMYFRDAAELQLAPAGGAPPRELLLGRRRRHVRRRDGRLVLLRGAADRRRPVGGGLAAVLGLRRAQGQPRVRRDGDDRLQHEDRQARDQGRGAERRHDAGLGRGRADGAGEDHEAEGEHPEQSLQAADGVVAALEVRAERDEARDSGEGDGGEQCVEGEPVRAARVGERRCERQEGRESTTSHGHLASLSGRTVLLCSRRSTMIDRQLIAATDGGLYTAHCARLARHQGPPALAPVEPTTLLGTDPPRDNANHRPTI